MKALFFFAVSSLFGACGIAQSMPAPPLDSEVDPLTTGVEWASTTGDDYKLVVVPVYNAKGVHTHNDLALSINGDPPVTTQHPVSPTTPIPITQDLVFYIGSMNGETMDLRNVNPAQPGIVILGLSGNDIIVGSSRGDLICAGAGDDVVFDFGGDDTIFGNLGKDALYGGPGADRIYGNGDDDNRSFPADPANGNVVTTKKGLVGGSENDVILGGPGNDWIYGEDGDDQLVCNDPGVTQGNRLHEVIGGAGSDKIWGCNDDSKRDRLFGDEPGDPTIQGIDQIDTGKGPDHVDAGPLGDSVFVGDVALSVSGNIVLTVIGGLGGDYIQLNAAWGQIYGDLVGNAAIGEGDTIDILGGHATKGYKIYCGGVNDQVLNGGPGNDHIEGQDGADRSLRGGEGDDGIWGGNGEDDILGGSGSDVLVGDGDADVLDGQGEADKLYDFSDACVDTLRGGDGDDELHCNDNELLNPDFNFGEGDTDKFEQDDIEASAPQSDVSAPETPNVQPPTPNISISHAVQVGW